LYYQPFIDKKSIQKQIIEEKRNFIYLNIKERFNIKDDILFLKKIIVKIKKNEKFLNSIKKISYSDYKNDYKNIFFIEKIFDYLILEKKIKKTPKILIKLLNIDKFKNNKKKEKLNIKKFLNDTKKNIKIKSETNKLLYLYDSKKNILNKDNIEGKKKMFGSFSMYVEKKDLEKMDNQLLYNTVKKYNEEKTKVG
jgi:hypothetical protein